MSYLRELDIARRAARRAGEAALQYWREGVTAETKADDSPVTVADRESERIIVEMLAEAFPGDGFLGEEGTNQVSTTGRRWIIDPVDGTRDFVRGSRMWAVQMAIEEGEEIVAGVCHFPALDETYYAARGAGAFLNDRPIHVSAIADPALAVLCVNDIGELHRHPFGGDFLEWVSRFWSMRNPGGSPDAMMVASGRAEAWIEPRCKAWDLAPHKVITEEAGGVFRNFDGGSSIYGGNCITSNPHLADFILEFVKR